MRILLIITILMLAAVAKTQTMLPGSFNDYTSRSAFLRNAPVLDSSFKHKWSFSRYAGLSAGYNIFKGGSASVIAAPTGLQLNRKLNNNLYAFAGVSLAPAYIHFNGALLPGDVTKVNAGNNFLQTNSFGMYSRAELGLMYINDAKTFSISGSIGIERSNVPVYYPSNTSRQNIGMMPNR